jgi:hypothetical protein
VGRSQVYSTGNTLENGGGSHPQSSILEESGAQPTVIGRKRKSRAGSCVLSWVFITQGVFLLFPSSPDHQNIAKDLGLLGLVPMVLFTHTTFLQFTWVMLVNEWD